MIEADKIYEAVEIAKKTGKIKKGANEVTKAVERGNAKLVVIAEDTEPKEIILHLTPLCKEKNVSIVSVPSKEDLGVAAGLHLATTSIAIVQEGDAAKIIKEIVGK